MKTCFIILSLLFAFISDCKGQVTKTRKASKGEVIYSSPYIGEPFPIDTARSASMRELLKMMQDSGIATMPFTTGGIAISRWRDTTTKKDTIPVIMLVCDTNNKYSFVKEAQIKSGFQLDSNWVIVTDSLNTNFYECDYNVHWQYGYSVREIHNEIEGSIDWYMDHNRPPQDYGVHLYYLDANKNKLPKNIIVWMAKEIEK